MDRLGEFEKRKEEIDFVNKSLFGLIRITINNMEKDWDKSREGLDFVNKSLFGLIRITVNNMEKDWDESREGLDMGVYNARLSKLKKYIALLGKMGDAIKNARLSKLEKYIALLGKMGDAIERCKTIDAIVVESEAINAIENAEARFPYNERAMEICINAARSLFRVVIENISDTYTRGMKQPMDSYCFKIPICFGDNKVTISISINPEINKCYLRDFAPPSAIEVYLMDLHTMPEIEKQLGYDDDGVQCFYIDTNPSAPCNGCSDLIEKINRIIDIMSNKTKAKCSYYRQFCSIC